MIKFVLGPDKTANDTNEVVIVTSKNQLNNLNLSEGALQKVNQLKGENKNGFITLYSNTITKIVYVIAKEEDKSASNRAEDVRSYGAALLKELEKEKIKHVRINRMNDSFTLYDRIHFVEGFSLAQYRFDKYKKKRFKEGVETVYLEKNSIDRKQIEDLSNLVRAISFTKDLVNEPPNHLSAPRFSELAQQMAKECGFAIEVLDKLKIESLNMGGLLGVNRGSGTPPTFNIFTHKPADAINEQPLVLVGKGVMFDTGGYSLKTGGYMSDMKTDMAGAAAVLGTIMAASLNKLPYYIVGLVPATDNKISANALVVDDIITISDGTTVEVQNTDAEGRLVLADALAYAKRLNPELVIDLATLTGAAEAITGSYGIAMAGNNSEAMQQLTQSGDDVYERLLELPMWREFDDLLKSEIADVKNIGGRVGGATTAAKFLERFTDYHWIHLDIAGAASIKENKAYHRIGATAAGVRLLYDFIKKRIS